MLQIVEDVNEPLWLFADASVSVVVVPGTDYHLVLLTNRLLLRKFIRGSFSKYLSRLHICGAVHATGPMTILHHLWIR